jgi:hypothetical protein
MDAFIAAGRTLIDVRFASGNGICIRFAARVAALGALGLRQYGVDAYYQGCMF